MQIKTSVLSGVSAAHLEAWLRQACNLRINKVCFICCFGSCLHEPLLCVIPVPGTRTGALEAVKPGNARQTEEDGFIVLNHDGSEMSAYHLWGE